MPFNCIHQVSQYSTSTVVCFVHYKQCTIFNDFFHEFSLFICIDGKIKPKIFKLVCESLLDLRLYPELEWCSRFLQEKICMQFLRILIYSALFGSTRKKEKGFLQVNVPNFKKADVLIMCSFKLKVYNCSLATTATQLFKEIIHTGNTWQ